MSKAEDEMVKALKQNAAINAASIAQRQNQAVAEEKSKEKGTKISFLLNALNASLSFNSANQYKTIEIITNDAEKFVAWLESKYYD